MNWNLLLESVPFFWHGTIVTIKIAYFSCLIGVILGTILALLQTSKITFFEWLVKIYVTIIRGTPMIIQIFFMFIFILPSFQPIYAAIVAIGLNSAAYVSQVIRAGINSVNQGQLEAARVMGLTKSQTVRFIILPQAIRVALPALGNEFATLIKDSSLAAFIGVTELFKAGKDLITVTYDPLPAYIALAIIYLLLTSIASLFVNVTERRMSTHVKD